MSLTNTEHLRDEIDIRFNQYVDAVKRRTKCNLNDGAVNSEGFFRNFLNLLYDFNLSRERIESPYNETIDLHNLEKKICVQITARNDKAKADITVKQFIKKKKNELYKELHFVIIEREKGFSYDENKLSKYGVKIFFHDCSTIFRTLKDEFDSCEKIRRVYDFIMSELSTEKSNNQSADFKRELVSRPSTDHNVEQHIVDQILQSLKTFDGFALIHPRTIAKLPIFNSKESYHYSYSNHCLKTSNKAIHELLQKIKINNYALTINDDSLMPFEEKLKEIFSILNHSLIKCICYREKYTEIEHHKINIIPFDPKCDCLYCQFHTFKINPLFSLLKGKAISHSENLKSALGEGYYLCKLGEHIKGWQVLNDVRKKSTERKNPVIQFLSEYNIKQIRGFVNSPWWESENKHILPEIEAIDLHNTLFSLQIPIGLRNELIKVKEEYFLHRSREIIEEQFESILSTNRLYARGGYSSGTAAVDLLREELLLLHAFYSVNHIIIDDFDIFRNIITKGIEGILISLTTDKSYEARFKKFDNLILSLMIFYVEERKLDKLLKEHEIKSINIYNHEKDIFIETMTNFFNFQFTMGLRGDIKFNEHILRQDSFSHYRQSLRYIFSRIMMILSKVELSSEELKPLAEPIVNFLRAAKYINHTSWSYFIRFFDAKIKIFSYEQIKTIIELIFDEKQHHSGDDVLESICELAFDKANFVLTDEDFFNRLLDSVTTPCKKCKKVHSVFQLLACWDIVDETSKVTIKQKVIEHLEKKIDPDFYMHAVFKNIFTKKEYPELLQKFIEYIVESCSQLDFIQEKGRWIVQNYAGHNYINCLAYMEVDFKQERVQAISKKSEYYNWLINFETYDYSNFDLEWLTHCPYYIKSKLLHVDSLKEKVKAELKRKYDPKLAEFFFGNLN